MALFRFRKCVVRLRPKFVLSFMNKYNVFCLVSLKGTKIPVIVSERDSPTEELPKIRSLLRDRYYPYADGIIFQTKAARDFINSRGSLCVEQTIIPNPIIRVIDPDSRKPDHIILAIGRLVPKKGFDQLLDAFAGMRNGGGWRLVICGDGPMRSALERRARDLGVYNCVEFAGMVKDLGIYYRKAGLFAFSSLYEGYPNALAEAMVSGLPCISYDCPTGPAEMIQHGVNGLLVTVGDVAALSAAMDMLVADSDMAQRLSIQAAKLGQVVATGAIAKRYLDYCESVAAVKVVG